MLSQCGRFVPAMFVGVEGIKGTLFTACFRGFTVVKREKQKAVQLYYFQYHRRRNRGGRGGLEPPPPFDRLGGGR